MILHFQTHNLHWKNVWKAVLNKKISSIKLVNKLNSTTLLHNQLVLTNNKLKVHQKKFINTGMFLLRQYSLHFIYSEQFFKSYINRLDLLIYRMLDFCWFLETFEGICQFCYFKLFCTKFRMNFASFLNIRAQRLKWIVLVTKTTKFLAATAAQEVQMSVCLCVCVSHLQQLY